MLQKGIVSRLTVLLISMLLYSCGGQKEEKDSSYDDDENASHSGNNDSIVQEDTIYSYHDNGEMRSLATVKNGMKQGRTLMFDETGSYGV
jgi:antitoxin component YwqK of YwqJK toxin-antitoxin module